MSTVSPTPARYPDPEPLPLGLYLGLEARVLGSEVGVWKVAENARAVGRKPRSRSITKT